MSDNTRHAANSDVLMIGQPKTLKQAIAWLRQYYAWKGLNFRDLRRHVIEEFPISRQTHSFRELLDWYYFHRYYGSLEEVCHVTNDNDYQCPFLANENVSQRSSNFPSAELVFPTMTQHPMAAFKGHRVTKFGYLPHDALVDRLGS